MDNLPLEPEHLAIAVDVLVSLLILISGVLAAFRAPKREFFSLLGWLGTLALTYWGARLLFGPVLTFARSPLYTEIIVIVAPLAIGILLFWIIGGEMAKGTARGDISGPGRFISFVLGLVRGAVLVSALYVTYAWRVPIDNQPGWVREATFVPHMQKAGTLLALGMGIEGRTKWANVLSGRDIDQGLKEEPAAEPAAPAATATTTPTTSGGTGTDESASTGATTAEPAEVDSGGTAETGTTAAEPATVGGVEPVPEEPLPEELMPEVDELQQLEETINTGASDSQ